MSKQNTHQYTLSNEEKVSIIMPCFNSSKYISDSIKSVLNQTYSNWELIIVDDCSSDGSAEIAESYAETDERIRFLKNETNKGAAHSRNKALSIAQGKWIAFLDSDDIWESNKLERQVSFMIEKNVLFSYTAYEQINEDGKQKGILVYGPKKCTRFKLYRYNYLGCLTVMFYKDAAGLIQIDETIRSRNDYALWLKVSKRIKTCYLLKEKLAKYRVRNNTLSHQKISVLLKDQYRLFRISERRNPVVSYFFAARNVFWGMIKKIIYVKREG